MMRTQGATPGFALLAALWLVVLVIGVTGALLVPLRTARLQARNVASATYARHAAASGLVHALAVLADVVESDDTGISGASMRLRRAQNALPGTGPVPAPGGGTYELSVEDESARLPVNRASEAEIRRLLVGLGKGHHEAAEIAAAVADWKDPDELHRLHGAEWDDYYVDVPGARRPTNGPFVTLGELRHVRGIDEALHGQLARILTVAPDAQVNLNTATEAVVGALPGMDRVSAHQVIELRENGQVLHTLEQLAASLDEPARERLQRHYPRLRSRVTFETATFRIASMGSPRGRGARLRLDALVAVHGTVLTVIRVEERRWQ